MHKQLVHSSFNENNYISFKYTGHIFGFHCFAQVKTVFLGQNVLHNLFLLTYLFMKKLHYYMPG